MTWGSFLLLMMVLALLAHRRNSSSSCRWEFCECGAQKRLWPAFRGDDEWWGP